MKTWKQFTFMAIAAIIALVFIACGEGNNDNGNTDTDTNQTPTAADFSISGTGTFTYDGEPKTVTAKEGKTSGAITVKYNGNTGAPSAVSIYTVTFDVAAATGWNAANGLEAGTLTINAANPLNQTPTSADFNISELEQVWDGSQKEVTITAKEGKSTGTITTYYDGDQAKPTAVGTYIVTFDVEAVEGFNAIQDLSAGTLIIAPFEGVFDDIEEMVEYLADCKPNTASDPIPLNISIDLEGPNWDELFYILYYAGRYVALDFSGSTGSTITGNYAVAVAINDFVVSIELPDSITILVGPVFVGLISLTTIDLSENIIFLNDPNLVFQDCNGLTAINVAENNAAYESVEGVLYAKSPRVLWRYPPKKTGTTFTIPDGVREIQTTAFMECTELTSVTIPESVTRIHWGAFQFSGLTSITIPAGVTEIGTFAFRGCDNLTSVTFEGTIDEDDFYKNGPFPGDLREKYLDEGQGTYTTTNPGDSAVWTKQ